MKPIFEVKYLDVKWFSSDVILSIKESIDSLELEFDEEIGHYYCNTVIYPEAKDIKHGRLAFRYLNKSNDGPFFKKTDGGQSFLREITDVDTGKKWWIEAETWNEGKKYWVGKMFNTPGTVLISLAKQTCQISIGLSGDTSVQLERYLSDFKSDLWELILDEDSYVTGDVKESQAVGVSEESIKSISKLILHAENILLSPKSELREIQAIRPRRMVKPVNRTFMELSTKGRAKYLTSRATEPSFNVPENQYLLFALLRTYKIIKQLIAVTRSKNNRFVSRVSKLEERLLKFSDHKAINKDLVKKDLERLRETYDIEQLNRILQEKIQGFSSRALGDVANRTCYIKIGKRAKYWDGVFVGIKNQRDHKWYESTDVRTVILKFANSDHEELFEYGVEYEVCGYFSTEHRPVYKNQEDQEEQSRKSNYFYTLESLVDANITGGEAIAWRQEKFTNELSKAKNLLDNGWIKTLNAKEIKEQEKEKQSVNIQLRLYKELHCNVQRVYELLEPKLSQLGKIVRQFQSLEIEPSPTFPNSMTFVQNPDYQAVHSGYKKIREISNLTDESLLLSLEKVDEIGLVNMPLLYERWCFLQIIKVLVQNYNYKPSNDWKTKLLKIVSVDRKKRGKTGFLEFTHPELNRRIKLRYEPKLGNGRYPDYVLDVYFMRKDGSKHTKRFVMDAKYYSKDILEVKGGIAGVLEELFQPQDSSTGGATCKNYSEDGKNAVFMIHPVALAIDPIVSPQIWGENSYFGELAMFDWDSGKLETLHGNNGEVGAFKSGVGDREQFHQYGAICANPASRFSYLDEFQRMIGMFLQYGIEDNSTDRDSDDVESFNFCIACGSHDLTYFDSKTRNSKSCWYECNSCRHFAAYNHCDSCKVRLIKNGDYWSYHSQKPMEPLNIKCPSCESLL